MMHDIISYDSTLTSFHYYQDMFLWTVKDTSFAQDHKVLCSPTLIHVQHGQWMRTGNWAGDNAL